jgi:hypothetical protein
LREPNQSGDDNHLQRGDRCRVAPVQRLSERPPPLAGASEASGKILEGIQPDPRPGISNQVPGKIAQPDPKLARDRANKTLLPQSRSESRRARRISAAAVDSEPQKLRIHPTEKMAAAAPKKGLDVVNDLVDAKNIATKGMCRSVFRLLFSIEVYRVLDARF